VYQKFKANRKKGYALIHAQPFENHHVLDAVPDFYERLEHSYDARFYEQEALGRFLNVQQGRVYYAFARQDTFARRNTIRVFRCIGRSISI